MKTHHLCPVYRKWLQLNPVVAREHRCALQKKTQQAHLRGDTQTAKHLGYQTFEAARVVLTALQPVSCDKDKPIHEDVLAFGTMGMYLANLLIKSDKTEEALCVLEEAQQQLMAILPLHATNPTTCKLIATLQQSLEMGTQHLLSVKGRIQPTSICPQLASENIH
jgi:hypothetical protein